MPRVPITRARPYTPRAGALANQTFHSERQYRNALARLHGFQSFATQQRSEKVVRSRAAYEKLRPAEREARDRVLDALARSRREGISLSRAAREAHTTPAAVRRYGGSYIKRGKGTRLEVADRDRLYRQMKVLMADGIATIDVYDSRTASALGEYWSAVKHWLETGDDRALRRLRRKSIRTGKRTYLLITDLEVIERLGRAGELSFESIYES